MAASVTLNGHSGTILYILVLSLFRKNNAKPHVYYDDDVDDGDDDDDDVLTT